MKIILLTSSLGAGGAERVASTLCNAWVDRGDQVTLIPTFSGGGAPFYGLDPRVELIYLASVFDGNTRKANSYLARLFALRNLISSRKPDVVISFLPNVNVANILATAFSRIPRIVCERSDPISHPLPIVWRFACKLLYRFADTVLVQTNAVSASIGNVYGGLKRVAVIGNPISNDLLRFSADLTNPRNRHVLLCLGRLSKEKQVAQIIAAFARCATTAVDWDLHIYGDGPEREFLASLIEMHCLQGRIFLKGRTDNPWGVMAKADAFVMNSAYEGFPNSLVEAMAVGLPCASSDCKSGPREITDNGKNALLFAVGDECGLRGAIFQLMTDASLRVVLGDRARRAIRERYSIDEVLVEWDSVFGNIVGALS